MDGTRRQFLKGGLAAAAGLSALTQARPGADASQVGRVTLPYPTRAIARLKALVDNEPVRFFYPDKSSPCLLIKLGRKAPGGVGPQEDIVAYSQYCTHQGCPVSYEARRGVLKCPCHFSLFDPEKKGQMICGQATTGLPRIALKHDAARGEIFAVAVEGLIYGRQANLL